MVNPVTPSLAVFKGSEARTGQWQRLRRSHNLAQELTSTATLQSHCQTRAQTTDGPNLSFTEHSVCCGRSPASRH